MLGALTYNIPWESDLRVGETQTTPFMDLVFSDVSAKITVDGITRRFTLLTADYTDLLATVRSLYSLKADKDLTLSWIDEEGDECRIDQQIELQEAIRCVNHNGERAPILKLKGLTVSRSYRSVQLFESYNSDDVSDNASDDSSDDGDSDFDNEDTAHLTAGAYYQPLSSLPGTLMGEMEDREMEEGLLASAMGWKQTLNSWVVNEQKNVGCQSEALSVGSRSAMSVQASVITHEQAVQVIPHHIQPPMNFFHPLFNAPKPRTMMTSTAAQTSAVVEFPSVTTRDACTQVVARAAESTIAVQVAPTIMDQTTQYEILSPSSSSAAHTFRAYLDASRGMCPSSAPDTSYMRRRRAKTVGFCQHPIKIPSVIEEEEEEEVDALRSTDGSESTSFPGSPYPRAEIEEADEEEETGERDSFVLV
ncbi:uncharacterized protein EV422DRAFT_616369 [Fimicolochytrium jonesii]|uniref:uncharacterized protein n=1 Tax=Fimicolochytrium jonesii TaxID=1396493 RepID=UPI0022FF0CD0|nr:uncharacterized protein EV422DRAFT_616369 [Fimicolochytrium jonesii]KAI8826964.1 hypothetical protein EV422DRAFT_616369 [Fimicolochytrium jonesii]